jgi:hypothetical protein
LEKIEKEFNLFGIQTHPIPLNPHGLSANRTSPNLRSQEMDRACHARATYMQAAGGRGVVVVKFQLRVKPFS